MLETGIGKERSRPLTLLLDWSAKRSHACMSMVAQLANCQCLFSRHYPFTPMSASLVTGQYCLTPSCVTVASAIINSIDPSVDPCHDFYQYTCGGWIKDNPLPDGKSIWGTFGKLWQENQLVMKNVLGDHTIFTIFTAFLRPHLTNCCPQKKQRTRRA